MTVTERLQLLQRCREFLQAQKDQARSMGRCVLYRLEDIHALIERRLSDPVCPYCRQPLLPASAMLANRIPVNRGGRFAYRNVEVACRDCLDLRGALDGPEFQELMHLIATWPKPVQNHFLDRLRRSGAGHTEPELPPVGSLEWFTGSAIRHSPPPAERTAAPLPPRTLGDTPCSA